jgi:hypothetical protein
MKTNFYLSFFLIAILVSCQKETLAPGNYLKADINGKQFFVYQDNRLNNDTIPDTFSFSFGQSTTNNVDTCLFLSVCLNRQNLYISFPKPTEEKTYIIYRKSNITGQPSAFYSSIPYIIGESGFETFYTQNMLCIESLEGQLIGEIIIEKIDTKSRVIIGRFSFSAYSYKVSSTETFIPTNKSICITNGEFFYQWDESLNL